MKAGIYRLAQDIHNPGRVDRRKTDWMFQPMIQKGLFVVTYHDLDVSLTVPHLGRLDDNKWWKAISGKREKVLFDAIAKHLTPVDHTRSYGLMHAYYKHVRGRGMRPDAVIEHLLKAGKITLKDLEKVFERDFSRAGNAGQPGEG